MCVYVCMFVSICVCVNVCSKEMGGARRGKSEDRVVGGCGLPHITLNTAFLTATNAHCVSPN